MHQHTGQRPVPEKHLFGEAIEVTRWTDPRSMKKRRFYHSKTRQSELDAVQGESVLLRQLTLQEMQKIRVKIEGFREDVRSFRAEFLERCPFGSSKLRGLAH